VPSPWHGPLFSVQHTEPCSRPWETAGGFALRREIISANIFIAVGCILLTGAGFSRNWGGWLANEAFEYLLGSSHINQPTRDQRFSYDPSKLQEHDSIQGHQPHQD
jgi:hypothetical protein